MRENACKSGSAIWNNAGAMQTAPRYRFGDTVIDATERRVDVGGRPAKLGARAFDVLLFAEVPHSESALRQHAERVTDAFLTLYRPATH